MRNEDTFNDFVDCAGLLLRRICDHFGETLGQVWADLYVNEPVRRGGLLVELITIADCTPFAREALDRIKKYHLVEDILAPPILEYYLVGRLKEIEQGPKAGGKEAYGSFLKDMAIVAVVNCLSTETGINATRNMSRTIDRKTGDYPKCCVEGGSAIDIVGIALWKHLGESRNYKAIENLWIESGLADSPLYRHGPAKFPILEHPISILRDRKRKKWQLVGGHFMEQPPLKETLRRSPQSNGPRSSEDS